MSGGECNLHTLNPFDYTAISFLDHNPLLACTLEAAKWHLPKMSYFHDCFSFFLLKVDAEHMLFL